MYVSVFSVAPDIVINPVGDEHTRPLGDNIIFTCSATGISPDVNPELKWIGTDQNEITVQTERYSIVVSVTEN